MRSSTLLATLALVAACKAPAATAPPREPTAVANTAPTSAASGDPDGGVAPAPATDLTLMLTIRRVKANAGSATGESYTNLQVARADGRWAVTGCVASLAGACVASEQHFLGEAQVAELAIRVGAVDAIAAARAPADGCYRVLTTVPHYQPDDYELDRGQRSYGGSLDFQGSCAPLAVATWLAQNGGL